MRRSSPWVGALRIALAALITSACAGAGNDAEPGDARLGIGFPSPAFDLLTSDGGTVRSAELIGRKPILLYFSMGPG